MDRGRFRVPHTLALLFGMVVLAYLLTLVMPQGAFERESHGGHDYVVADSYTKASERTTLPVWTPLVAVPKGFDEAKEIIFFVFIIGGAFGVFRATGAADALIGFLLEKMGNKPALLIAGSMLIFACGAATMGMAEEFLPFVPMLLALLIGLGYDALTAVGVLVVGYGVGYGAAVINPFTVLIAQDIAGVTPTSGATFRIVLLLVFLAIGFHHVWSYAGKVRKSEADRETADVGAKQYDKINAKHISVLAVLAVGLGLLLWGLIKNGWYLVEMGALFFGLAIAMGVVGRIGVDETAKKFCIGASELTTTALLIGVARAIGVVLTDGQIIDTIIHGIAEPLKTLGPHVAAVGMLAVQSVCNLFIPSGSGQAYVTMPIMAPLSDIVGVSRQTSVLAYQFGDGFTNIVVPTNPVLIGILTMAGVSYERWLRFVIPFLLKALTAAALALVVAVAIGYN
ncbi:MAG: TIGR00366 family protein [Acidobacteriota bacterium]|nr:TIGR00366 family protein [Acidobacteriota bacterium]MDH3785238.1 TIGR00366 family protein [Acidobacteriota bacterium]